MSLLPPNLRRHRSNRVWSRTPPKRQVMNEDRVRRKVGLDGGARLEVRRYLTCGATRAGVLHARPLLSRPGGSATKLLVGVLTPVQIGLGRPAEGELEAGLGAPGRSAAGTLARIRTLVLAELLGEQAADEGEAEQGHLQRGPPGDLPPASSSGPFHVAPRLSEHGRPFEGPGHPARWTPGRRRLDSWPRHPMTRSDGPLPLPS